MSQSQIYLPPANYKCTRETRSAPSCWQQCSKPRGWRKSFGGPKHVVDVGGKLDVDAPEPEAPQP